MTAQTLLQSFLLLHIVGFILMAGTVTADFALHRRMNKYLSLKNNMSRIHVIQPVLFMLIFILSVFRF
ncbi:hypothetical protein [Deminuibacter soli]|uniref:DUF2214 family protein n=1 Tax=Deminuibacter soli TaxID=2291815 RepID=A0A3E1NJS1_9BACT|nr:hypothetical protein [Deminuibacter soli]RFM28180.1 hypothetical protein DXN05_11705 [Deminuibacter soli]